MRLEFKSEEPQNGGLPPEAEKVLEQKKMAFGLLEFGTVVKYVIFDDYYDS